MNLKDTTLIERASLKKYMPFDSIYNILERKKHRYQEQLGGCQGIRMGCRFKE
jgi:hypothetical protein